MSWNMDLNRRKFLLGLSAAVAAVTIAPSIAVEAAKTLSPADVESLAVFEGETTPILHWWVQRPQGMMSWLAPPMADIVLPALKDGKWDFKDHELVYSLDYFTDESGQERLFLESDTKIYEAILPALLEEAVLRELSITRQLIREARVVCVKNSSGYDNYLRRQRMFEDDAEAINDLDDADGIAEYDKWYGDKGLLA